MKHLPKLLVLPVSAALLLTSSLAFSAGSFTARPAPQKSTGYMIGVKYYIGRAQIGYGVRDCNNSFSMKWGKSTTNSEEVIIGVCAPPADTKPNRFKAK